MQTITKELKEMIIDKNVGIFEVLEKISDYCLKTNKELLNVHTYKEMAEELGIMASKKCDYFDGFAVTLSKHRDGEIFYCDFAQWERLKRGNKYIPLLIPVKDKTGLVNLAIKQLNLK